MFLLGVSPLMPSDAVLSMFFPIGIEGKIIAFTYGGPVNYDTFDTCAEKADFNFEGAFAMINREFARHLPEQFVYINREEDLGLPGLRRSKESYRPAFLLNKFTVMERHPMKMD